MSADDLLLHQNGVLTRAQAIDHGLSARTVARRVATGAWRCLHPGVYLVGGHRLTDEAAVRAAWLWAGDRSVVSGPAAAYWHGLLRRSPTVVELTLPRRRHRSAPPGLTVRRRDLDRADRARLGGVGVTAMALTVLEVAPVVPGGATFLDRALQKHVSFPELYRAYCRSVGARGSGPAGAMLTACADRADSAAERLFLRLLRDAGMVHFAVAHPFGKFTIDVAFPAARVAVEVDGWAWHSDAERFRTDRRKGNALVGAGWTLLRFTWADLTERPAAVIAQLRAALARAA